MPHPVDVHIGQKIRHERLVRGLTQQQLAVMVKVTFQQLQKYETATNRVSASRLLMIASALELSINDFYKGYSLNDPGRHLEHDQCESKEAARLVLMYQKMPEPQRRVLFSMVRVLAGPADTTEKSW